MALNGRRALSPRRPQSRGPQGEETMIGCLIFGGLAAMGIARAMHHRRMCGWGGGCHGRWRHGWGGWHGGYPGHQGGRGWGSFDEGEGAEMGGPGFFGERFEGGFGGGFPGFAGRLR